MRGSQSRSMASVTCRESGLTAGGTRSVGMGLVGIGGWPRWVAEMAFAERRW